MASDRDRPPLGTVLDLRVLSGTRSNDELWFFDSERIRIGRNPANDVVLPDGAVSRYHAELLPVEGGFALSDLSSMAGTFVFTDETPHTVTAAAPRLLPLPGTYDLCFGSSGPRCRIGLGVSVPFGRYRLVGRLGGGGMAEVYLARQSGLGGFNRPVALKLIQPEMFDLVDATTMFLDEGRIAAEINHHNVVKIFDVGEQDGVLFLAMEYLRGITLSHLNAQIQQRGERMPADLVAALLAQACSGLQAAHSLRDPSGRLLNVVHRDVSPSNLMVGAEGMVKVIDFGVARADTRLLRREEGLQGKPAYMSPEQIQGQPLDCRSDIFALGVVLYELCSGRPLFQREETVATFYAVVRDEVPPLRSVCAEASERLEQVVHRALAKDPSQRFQSAAELGAALDQVVLEAGGRFASISAIARLLTEWGVNLSGPSPSLLTQVPKPLLPRPGVVVPPPIAIPKTAPPEPPPSLPPLAPLLAASAASDYLSIEPPPPEQELSLTTPSSRLLRISTLAVPAGHQHRSLALPLNTIAGLLPAPLSLLTHDTTLLVELAVDSGGGRGRDRPSLYQDAHDPNTRCESYTLPPSSAVASFDVGHRRVAVQRIYYCSAVADSQAGQPLQVSIPELKLVVAPQEALLRLCVLYVSPTNSQTAHLVCVLITPQS